MFHLPNPRYLVSTLPKFTLTWGVYDTRRTWHLCCAHCSSVCTESETSDKIPELWLDKSFKKFLFKPTLQQSLLQNKFITIRGLFYFFMFWTVNEYICFLEFRCSQIWEMDLHLQKRTSFRKHWKYLAWSLLFVNTQTYPTYLNKGNIQMQIEWIALFLFRKRMYLLPIWNGFFLSA